MLGRYDNFPTIIHGIVRLLHQIPLPTLQQLLIASLHEINGRKEPYEISVADHPGTYQGELSFEVGVAEGVYFNYLDNNELNRLYESLSSKGLFGVLDFLIIVGYHYSRGGKKIALKFDRNILRFIFYENMVELSLFNEKGIRRMPLDEFLNYVIKNLNQKIEKNDLPQLKVEHFRTL